MSSIDLFTDVPPAGESKKVIPPEARIPRHAQAPKKYLITGIFRGIGVFFSVLLISALSLSGIAFVKITEGTPQQVFADPGISASGVIPQIAPASGEINVLLVGSDSRLGSRYDYGTDPGSMLNDVNMLLTIDEARTNATVISFPRDLFVAPPDCQVEGRVIPARSSVKINSLLSSGGMPCIRATVEKMTGLSIPYSAVISFDGVIDLSNAVGGVEVCVGTSIDDPYTLLELEAGLHTLSGEDALKFLRTRYGVGDGSDLSRIGNQQAFLASMLRKLQSDETLTNPAKLYSLAEAILSNAQFSESLTVTNLISLMQTIAPFDLTDIKFVQYPSVSSGNGLDINRTAAEELLASLQTSPLSSTDTSEALDSEGLPEAPESAEAPDISQTPATASEPVPVSRSGQTADQVTCTV